MSEHTAELHVRIAARPVTVFALFVNRAAFAKWMGADMGIATIEPELGGAVRVEYGGGAKIAAGKVVALDSPRHFAFTWGYEDGQPFAAGSTRVDITLEEDGDYTVLTLRHSGLPSEIAAREHAGGWRLYTGIIGNMAACAQYGASLGDIVRGWFDAWAEDDAEKRAALVASCFAEDGTFHHPYALVSGREQLSAHIASSRRHMQGMTLELDGKPEQVHHHVRFRWRVVREGEVASTGENVAALGADGLLASVVGFTEPQ